MPTQHGSASYTPVVYSAPFASSVISDHAYDVVRSLQGQGYRAFIVGGAVRDLLLGRVPRDFDVATTANPKQIRRIFPHSQRIQSRQPFQLVTVFSSMREKIDVTSLKCSPGARDTGDWRRMFWEDAHERDLTVNALLYDPIREEILDFVNGWGDVTRTTLRAIGDPAARFQEDPIRTLRAIKFAAQGSWALHSETRSAIIECRAEILNADRNRIRLHCLRLLQSGSLHASILLAWELRVLRVILPDLAGHLNAPAGNEERERCLRLFRYVDEHLASEILEDEGSLVWMMVLFEPIRQRFGFSGRRTLIRDYLESLAVPIGLPTKIVDEVAQTFASLGEYIQYGVRGGMRPQLKRNLAILYEANEAVRKANSQPP